MTDENPNAGGTIPGTGGGPQDESQWQQHAQQGESREWLSQLQNMIEQLATQAAPVVREVGAKAAELAAAAGEKAGPVAHRAAELTSEAGLKLAERSRTGHAHAPVVAPKGKVGDPRATVSRAHQHG